MKLAGVVETDLPGSSKHSRLQLAFAIGPVLAPDWISSVVALWGLSLL